MWTSVLAGFAGSCSEHAFKQTDPVVAGLATTASTVSLEFSSVPNSLTKGRICRSARGFTYKGEKRDGVCHGQGRIVWSDGTALEGKFNWGYFPTFGTMTDTNGFRSAHPSTHKDFECHLSLPFLISLLTRSAGRRYEGHLRGQIFHGEGVVTWGSGRAKYEGGFVNGQFHGQGIHQWDDGCMYNGGASSIAAVPFSLSSSTRLFLLGAACSLCTSASSLTRCKSAAGWENGKRNGQGFCAFGDLNEYDGEWEDDFLHGVGVRVLPPTLPPR